MNQLIGRGPVAEVYAVDGRALKVFPGKFDRRTLATLERERVKLAGAAAPLLAFDGVEVVGGSRHALRMELCADSLAERVRRDGPLPSEEVAALCWTLSRALSAAHALGVLHGGVGPANVMYRVTGEAVLADFGVAQRETFRRGPLVGIEWISPETLRTGVVEAPTDVYGLGAVLHFALTGQSPHPSRIGELTGERILRVLSDPVPAVSRPDVPIGLATAISRMLAPHPQNRSMPSSGDQLAEREPTGSTRTTGTRRWRYWAAAVAAVVVLAAVLTFVLWPDDDEPPPEQARPLPAEAPTPTVELHEPTDLDDEVELTWSTNDDRLFFAVTFWREGRSEDADTRLAENRRTLRVPVDPDPGQKYCFVVRGTVSVAGQTAQIHESQVKAVRGAVCHE